MRAAVWTGPREMQIQEVERPAVAAGELLLRVNTVGICGSELSGYLGENSLRVPPLIMGHEFGAVVEDVGEGVTGFAVGDRVTANPMVPDRSCVMCRAGFENLCLNRTLVGAHRPGAFAEYVAVPAIACYILPDAIDDLTASLVEPTACALRAVELAAVTPGSSVLILGAGPIGLLSLLVAKAAGASEIIISDLSQPRLDLATSWGATVALSPAQDDVVAIAKDRTGGLGVDAVIDAVGLPVTRNTGISAVRPGGKVIFIGLHEDATTIPGNTIIRSEIEIKGSFCYTANNFTASIRLLATGFVPDPRAWVDLRPLDQAGPSFDQLIDDPSSAIKIVLTP